MPGYLLKDERIAIAGAADLWIRSLLDRQQFADPRGEAAAFGISSAAWPLFGLLWPSALQLAGRLATHPLVAGERILELGCGLGLASLVGHRRGADMTASDCHPLAGAFLAENLRLNGLPPLAYRHGDWASVAGAPGPPGHEPLRGRFDLVIGSDLLYERDDHGVLAGYIDRHATAQAPVWIVDPNRGNRSAFNRQMAAHGYDLVDTPIVQPASPRLDAYRGRWLVYRRPARDPAGN